ncbi:MAG: transglycosylase SLT domain-containing protein [Burkholderiales bacterium]|nr:transglycosylase SLT domain-containing protein [Burkholderiales bacterium]
MSKLMISNRFSCASALGVLTLTALLTAFLPASVGHAQVNGASPADVRLLVLEARSYEHGEGVPKDGPRAARLYCEAARAGDAEAQFSLGWMYANARGVPRDDATAAHFFGLAARQGHVHAQRMLRFVDEAAAAAPECMAPPRQLAEVAAEPPPQSDDELPVPATPAQRKVVELLSRLAPEYGVHPRLAFAVIRAESNFDPGAVSPKNAQGLMQLIPETSARFNVAKPFDPEQNVRGGLAYLRWLLAYFKGKVPLVAAAYNAGEGNVNKFRGIPPFAETQGYVRRIVEIFKREDHPYDERVTAPSPELPRIRLGSLM